MSDTLRLAAVSQFLADRITAGDFPSAVYLVAARGRVVFADALGDAVRAPVHRPATLDTIFDLASLTKPFVTGLLSARRIERGELTLDASVGHYLPDFAGSRHQAIAIRHLLTHTSGLPSWLPLYLITHGQSERALEVIAEQALIASPGERVVYSDLGFITLGILLEKVSGSPLAELARREIFAPLNLQSTGFSPDNARRGMIAACESAGNAYEREMCREMNRAEAAAEDGSDFWRQETIWGAVHDGNAYFLGGAAGHAGLFSDARETLQLAEQFIANRTRLLRSDTCQLFRTDMTEGLNEARSLAWQLAATPDSTAGDALPPDSFGHLGFTGTSCWIDAARERVFILLTNRTHARAFPFVNINSIRRTFHTLAASALERTALA